MSETTKIKVGDRVKDSLKRPKPGDECVTGTVRLLSDGVASVEWDAPDSLGRKRTNIDLRLLEKIDG